ncbi:hypothetical protein GV827_20385, partial [Sulfitobacter sp. JBTF-M27]|nr:hypothetical protein [Sulfitobacter sediminilitoris]
MPLEVGSKVVDGNLSDWNDVRPLFSQTGFGDYALYGETWANGTIFAISGTAAIGTGTTIWLDTDLDRSTGYQIWGFTGGAEYNIQIAADGSAALYSGAGWETLIAELEVEYGPDNLTIEVAFPASVLSLDNAFRVYADVNDQVFLPGDYSNIDLVVPVEGQSVPATVVVGHITLDGDLSDWAENTVLYADDNGSALRGTISGEYAVFALSAPLQIGQATTIWLDTDLDRSTGHQIWGFAGGAEYNIEIAVDGSAALYAGNSGETFVADLDARYAADGTIAEVAVPLALAGIVDSVRVLADINNSIFLPGDYANVDLIVDPGDQTPPTPVAVGDLTLDGDLSDWAENTVLYADDNGSALRGTISGEYAVFALSAPLQ